MSRNKTFNTWEDCRIWMCGAIGERWVKDKDGDFWKGRDSLGCARMPSNSRYAPFTAIRDERGDILEEVKLPELDAEFASCQLHACRDCGAMTVENSPELARLFQLAIAQAVRMSKEGKSL